MENLKFRKFCIKNFTFDYFDSIIKLEDFDIDNILIDEISHKNIYDISYRTLIGLKPLRIRFNRINGCLVLLALEKYDTIYNKIKYLKSQKVASHRFFLLLRKNQNWFL